MLNVEWIEQPSVGVLHAVSFNIQHSTLNIQHSLFS